MKLRFPHLAILLLLWASLAHAAPHKLALIFKGPTICDDCAELLAPYMKERGLEVHYVKPGETSSALLAQAAIYVVPGGEDVTSLGQAWTADERNAIRAFVAGGGLYYGVCLGGYWAGRWPGTLAGFQALDLIPGDVVAHSATPEDRVEKILWEGKPRWAYFQDGPAFRLRDGSARIFATYEDGSTAAFIAPFGRGRVGVSGVHLEAPRSWYDDTHLRDPDGLDHALFRRFLTELFRRVPNAGADGPKGARSSR